MTKVRAKPSIAKPVIDARAAMDFIAAPHKSSAAVLTADKSDLIATAKKETLAGYVQLDVPLKEELYGRLEAEARRKGKTVAEVVGKLINKHIAKH